MRPDALVEHLVELRVHRQDAEATRLHVARHAEGSVFVAGLHPEHRDAAHAAQQLAQIVVRELAVHRVHLDTQGAAV